MVNANPFGPGFRPIIDSSLGYEEQAKIDNDARKARDEQAKVFKTIEEGKEITEEELSELDYTEVMNTERFLELAKAVLKRADLVINRADAILSHMTPTDPISISSDQKENLDLLGIKYTVDKATGNLILSPAAISCIMRLASYNPETTELSEVTPSNIEPSTALKYLRTIAKTDKINSKFPKWGLMLLFFVLRLASCLTVQKLLNRLCALFGRLNFKLPFKIRLNIGRPLQRIVDKACWTVTGIFDRWFRVKGDRLPSLRAHACNKSLRVEDIVATQVSMIKRHILGQRPDVYSNEGKKKGSQVCEDGYVPTDGEIAVAREIAREIYKSELNDDVRPTARNLEASWIQLMRTDAVRYRALGGDLVAQIAKAPKVFAVDEVRGDIIGFFSVINGALKATDKALSGIVQLEFLSPKAKEWVCCFVRLFYVFLPLIASKIFPSDVDKAKQVQKQLHDFFSGKVDWRLDERSKVILEALDSIMGYALGSSYINIDFELPFDTDYLMGAIYEALAEVLAMLNNTLFGSINESINSTMSKPINAEIVALCKPFQYWLGLIRCTLNNLSVNIMDMLSMMWLKGNEKMKSFESTFEVIIMKRNVSLFRNVLKLVLNFGARLRNFCDMNEVTTKADVEEVLKEVDKLVAYRDEDIEPDSMSIMTTPVYKDPDSPAGPDWDSFVNTDFMRKDRGLGALDINIQTSPMYAKYTAGGRETYKDKTGVEQPLTTKSPLSDAGIDANAQIDPCGDAFKEILKKFG